MGGYGSGRWGSEVTKHTVEDCLSLKIKYLVKKGLLQPNRRTVGTLTWSNSITNEVTSTIGYEVDTTKTHFSFDFIRLFYTRTKVKDEVDYKILLTTTQPNYGGLRWWFRCSLMVNNRPCTRKVANLYLSSSSRYFGCRHCLDLTYRSCQESDKRVNWLRNNPLALQALLNRVSNQEDVSNKDLFMALKVLYSAEKHF